MLEKSDHYSNKGGHKIRGLINKLVQKGIIADKREVSLCIQVEESIVRIPEYEKR